MQLQLDVRRNCRDCQRHGRCMLEDHLDPAKSVHNQIFGYLCGPNDKRTPGSTDDILVAVANCCQRFEAVDDTWLGNRVHKWLRRGKGE